MRNIWNLFKSDVRQLTGNIVTILTVIGLVALPSIFSWYNILACWDVFGNTGNLTVAVASSDAGYTSDLAPLEVNVGDKVVAALRENNQLNWVFTDEEDAIDGVSAGRYYAAVVIPPTFSSDMMSFYSDDVEHAQITYYSNQKKSAIAPKVTDQGADQVSNKVNTAFAETISEVAIGLSTALAEYADQSDANGRLESLAKHIAEVGNQLDDSAAALSSYSSILESSQSLITTTSDLLQHVKASSDEALDSVRGARSATQSAVDAMENAISTLRESLSATSAKRDQLSEELDSLFAQANTRSEEAEAKLRAAASAASERGLTRTAERLIAAADAVHLANADTQSARADTKKLLDQTSSDIAAARESIDANLSPKIDTVTEIIADARSSLTKATDTIETTSNTITSASSSLSGKLGNAKDNIDGASRDLTEGAAKLKSLAAQLTQALNSDDMAAVRSIIGNDPDALAAAIAAPVKIERIAVYPAANFGSAMAPLYTSLALWIGALLIMVTLKMRPSEQRQQEIGSPTSRQIFIGRFLAIALISLMQSTVLSVGNLLFLEIQAVNPFLYILCFWVAGLVFAFIIYTMVSLFANLGKALGVVLLIVQVGGGGGSFPLQLLPQFFQSMSPFLPIAHAVRAMRAAMFGVYAGDFWIEIGMLLLFTMPFGILGLALNKPLSKVVPKFIERVEASKLM